MRECLFSEKAWIWAKTVLRGWCCEKEKKMYNSNVRDVREGAIHSNISLWLKYIACAMGEMLIQQPSNLHCTVYDQPHKIYCESVLKIEYIYNIGTKCIVNSVI